MPRITHVKRAQPRYETKPVLDENGEQKYTVHKLARATKRGKTEYRQKVTERDLTKPLPPEKCDFQGCEIDGGQILPGTPYKHMSPKSGPYGGRRLTRHEQHPNWNVWEYSSSRSAQVARTQSEMHDAIDSFEFGEFDDFEGLKQELVDAASEQRDEVEDSLNNLPDSLQDGSVLQEQYDALESWADEIDSVDQPDVEDVDCETCAGTGKVDNPNYDPDVEEPLEGENEEETDCDDCDGSGQVTPTEPDDDWIDAAKDVLREAVDNCEL